MRLSWKRHHSSLCKESFSHFFFRKMKNMRKMKMLVRSLFSLSLAICQSNLAICQRECLKIASINEKYAIINFFGMSRLYEGLILCENWIDIGNSESKTKI